MLNFLIVEPYVHVIELLYKTLKAEHPLYCLNSISNVKIELGLGVVVPALDRFDFIDYRAAVLVSGYTGAYGHVNRLLGSYAV